MSQAKLYDRHITHYRIGCKGTKAESYGGEQNYIGASSGSPISSPPSETVSEEPTVPKDVPKEAPKKTYSQILKNSSKGMNLSFVQSEIGTAITIEEDDISKELEYCQITLVGTVLGWYYFRFASAKDMEKIRFNTWNVNGFPLVFKSWSPTVIDELTISHVPIWVLFLSLDPCFWSKTALSKVASLIGNPICADEHTTNKSKLAFGHILVDVDLSKELPKAIQINSPYRGTLLQKVEYEWIPHFCSVCKKVGHSKERCNTVNPKPKPKVAYKPKPVAKTTVQASAVATSPPPGQLDKGKTVPGTKSVAVNLSNRFVALQNESLLEPDDLDGDPLEDCLPGEEVFSQQDVDLQRPVLNLKHFWMFVLLLSLDFRLERRVLWQQLSDISSTVSNPWACMGDFNVVLKMDERLGCDHLHLADMNEFGRCLDSNGLVDHPATGSFFTWNNKQGDGLRWAKLDRVLTNQQWIRDVGSIVTFLEAGDNWLVCTSGGKVSSLFQKLKHLKKPLRGLHSSSFTGLAYRVKTAKTALLEKQLLYAYTHVKRAEMLALQQRAKVHDLKLGDNSTKFFYSQIAARRMRNTIGCLHDENGDLRTRLSDVVVGFVSYYQNLLGTSSFVQSLPADLFQQGLIPPDSYANLDHLVLSSEILDPLKSVDRNKSPGIDGYSSGFFLDAWSVVGHDFKEAVSEFFLHGHLPKAASSTFLVLIPKIDTPSSVRVFRPIACCTTYYKVVIKNLANRLKGVLDHIIGPEQASFISWRDLFDNSMMAHKLASKYSRAYLTPRCFLKVDIRKALTLEDLLSVLAVAHCLSSFDAMSSLRANPAKTSLCFGGVGPDLRKSILLATNFTEGAFPFRYLGLPLFNARIANAMYQPLMDKIKDKIAHWSNHSLSYAGPNSFSVDQMYYLLRNPSSLVSWTPIIHDSACVPKHSFIGMLIMDNKLPTVDNLVLRGLHIVNRYMLCCQQGENVEHLFFQCSYSRAVWTQIADWLGVYSSADLQAVIS
ncbi:uncharacterized protein LOC141649606 [Silene latifolia]|uniref:uncharacterized protein LOC141649606 n=1 Tax=Silene latifolia TaxID=37657 RepID=UPI003D77629A